MEYKVSITRQLSDIIKSKRKSLGLTQATMGKRVGISQRVYARNEAHPERVHFERILNILAELNMNLIVSEQPLDTKAASDNAEPW